MRAQGNHLQLNSVIITQAWLLLPHSASVKTGFVSTGGWYAGLAKPTWNPPGWIFGPVWTILYTLMAVAAWRVWLHGGWARQKTALSLYLIQWALKALETPLFFDLRLGTGWALAEPAGGHSGDHAGLLAGRPACWPPIAPLYRVGRLCHDTQLVDLAAELRVLAIRTGWRTADPTIYPSALETACYAGL